MAAAIMICIGLLGMAVLAAMLAKRLEAWWRRRLARAGVGLWLARGGSLVRMPKR